MTHELHLGPYLGRDADLADLVGGVLCNPMTQAARVAARSSRPRWSSCAIPTATTPPARVGPRLRRRRRRSRRRRSRVLARACADGPLVEPGTLDARRGSSTRSRTTLDGPGWVERGRRAARPSSAPPATLPEAFPAGAATTRSAPRSRRGRPRPAREAVGRTGRAAPDPAGPRRSIRAGRAPGRRRPIPSRRCTTLSWSPIHGWALVPMNTLCSDRASPSTRPSSSSPTGPGRPSTSRPSLREDANVIDRLCRLALGTYEAWRTCAAGAVRGAGRRRARCPFRRPAS